MSGVLDALAPSPDEALADALRRDDLPWIATFLERPLVPESALRRLLDGDAPAAHLALLHLGRAARA